MSQPGYTGTPPNAWTFVTANIAVANSIKTSIATATADINYTGATLNGANKTPTPDGKSGWSQWPTATASNSAGVFTAGSIIRFTSTYKGVVVVRSATVVGTDGNATFVADGPVDGPVTNIFVPAQTTTGGTWTFGFADLECVRRSYDAQQEPFREVRGGTAANIGFYRANGEADILPCTVGEHHRTLINRIRTSTTTSTPITLYE
jgi:hypothetical protein